MSETYTTDDIRLIAAANELVGHTASAKIINYAADEIDRLRGVLADTIRSTEANRLCISIYTQSPSPDTYLSLDESDRVVLRQLDTARDALADGEGVGK